MKELAGPIDVAEVLAATNLFAQLQSDDLASVAGLCVMRSYGKGQYLFFQGDPGDRLFIIARGLVKVTFTSERGDEMVMITLNDHDVTGELAVLDGGPRSASVVAAAPTTVLTLSRPDLLRLMSAHQAVLNALLTSLGAMVRRLTEQAGDLVFLDLGTRLAKLLLRLAQGSGQVGDRIVLDLGLSQSDLAAMVGGSRPAVNRALQVLSARGLLKISGQKIIVHDLEGLRRRAGS